MRSGLRNEIEGSKRWEDKTQLRTLRSDNRRNDPGVPHVAASIKGSVGVQHLAPVAREGHADVVVVSHLRGEIDDDDAALARIAALTQPGEDASAGVVGDEPLKAVVIAIHGV